MDNLSQSRGMHPNGPMSMIGWAIAAVLFVGLLPLLPVFLLYLVVDRLVGSSDETDVAG